jgi:uncharacterized membrane protein
MDQIARLARYIFALAITALGVENVVCARFVGPAIPVLPWMPANPLLAYLAAAVLIVTGICIAANIQPRLAPIFLAVFLFSPMLTLRVPEAIAHPFDIGLRTLVFEILALAAAALTLPRTLSPREIHSSQPSGPADKLLASGRYLFAISSVVFGVSHFILPRFIASLIPPWFPGALFWAYFTAVAFVAAGFSIAVKIMDRLAAALLGVMFLIWFLFLHTPRLLNAAHSHNPNEWSSAFIALGMCGASWIIAQASLRERRA